MKFLLLRIINSGQILTPSIVFLGVKQERKKALYLVLKLVSLFE